MERYKMKQLDAFLPERLSTFLFVITVISLAISAYLSQHLYWSDSEMWPLSVVRNIFSVYSHQDFFVKPLFNLLLLVVHGIAIRLDVLPLDLARIVMSLNLILIATLVFRITKWITQNELLALATTVFLITSITMLEQGTRIRSDLIVCTLNLLTLDLILRKGNQKFGVWIPALLSLLVTPKAIYWLLALYPFYPAFKQWTRKKLLSFVVISLVIVGLIVAFRFQTVNALAKYFILSFTREGSGLDYLSSLRFEHVLRAMAKDPLFWFLIFARLLWVRSFKGFDAMFVILLLALLLHPDRMPFFIVSLMPFFIVIAASHSAFSSFFKKMQIQGRWIFTLVLGLVFAFAMQRFLVRTSYLVTDHNNADQRQAIHLIQSYLEKSPYVLTYDPVGIIYKTPAPYDWYIGPGEIENNHMVMQLLRVSKPDIFLYTMRVRWLEPDIYRLLQEEYVNLGGGVYAHYPQIEITKGQKFLTPEDLLEKLPEGKVVVNPETPVRLFIFDKNKNDISQLGYWIFEGDVRERLSSTISLHIFQTQLKKVELPPQAQIVRVSFWNTLEYSLATPLYSLFRFDSEL